MTTPDWFPIVSAIVSLVLLVALGVLLLFANRRTRRLEARLGTLFAGVESDDLQGALDEHLSKLAGGLADIRTLDATQKAAAQDMRTVLRRVSLIRYNPFGDTGGDQSFSMVLADDEGRGIILTSLHSREASRVYGKPLVGWSSAYALSEDEVTAIGIARDSTREPQIDVQSTLRYDAPGSE